MRVEEGCSRYSGLSDAARYEHHLVHHNAVRHADRDGDAHHTKTHSRESSVPQDLPTEIKLTAGALVLYKGRLGTISKIGRGGRIAWVESADDGGRMRTFSAFIGGDLKILSIDEYDVLDSIVAATAAPTNGLDQLGRIAELWFANPRVGDVFYKPHRFYFLEIKELTAAGALRAELRSCRETDEGDRTEQLSFSSIKRFQEMYEYKTQLGYDLLAYSSLRNDEMVRMKVPSSIGEVK